MMTSENALGVDAAEAELYAAVQNYSADQSEANRQAVETATSYLHDLLGWPETEKMAPAHRRRIELTPEHLRWPDAIWGDTIFD